VKIILNIILFFLSCCNIYSQTGSAINQPVTLLNKENTVNSFTAVSIGMGAFLYVINPILEYENKSVYAGLTKELSVGFGKFGEHRLAFEYSFIFSGNISNQLRLSYKYDLLFKENIKPSHMLQGSSALSLGAGYFANFSKTGIFPELTLGYSFRNDKILIFPHIKLRHTFMFKKQDTDITDISFGIILGIANPFNDVIINRND